MGNKWFNNEGCNRCFAATHLNLHTKTETILEDSAEKGEGRSPAVVATNSSSRRKIPSFAGLQKLPHIIKKFQSSLPLLHVGSSLKLVVKPRFATATPRSLEPHRSRRCRPPALPFCSTPEMEQRPVV
nr:hypothetical protein Itr_chr13CG15130 [Ipomoea trifida]